MVNHLKQSEKIITELINSEPGIKYNFESKIEAIKELPINNFSEIRKLLTSGKKKGDACTSSVIENDTEIWLIKSFVLCQNYDDKL